MTDYGLKKIAEAIMLKASGAQDATGGLLANLAEAVMQVAHAINRLAAAAERANRD